MKGHFPFPALLTAAESTRSEPPVRGRINTRKSLCLATILLTATQAVCPAQAADKKSQQKPDAKTAEAPSSGPTLPYTTTIVPTSDADLNAAMSASSDLVSLQKTHAIGPFALAGRIRSDYDRLKTALESFGYYEGSVKILVTRGDKAPVPPQKEMSGDDIGLPQWLLSLPAGEKVSVRITATTGPLYHLGTIGFVAPADTTAATPAPAATKTTAATPAAQTASPPKKPAPVILSPEEIHAFGLKSGDPAIASNVLAAGGTLASYLQEEGHPLADVGTPTAYLRPATKTLNVTWPVTVGPAADIGSISLDGLRKTHAKFVRRRLTIAPGQKYQPSRIEDSRQDLAALGVFSTVSVKNAPALAPDGTMPLTFTFKEAKRHSVGAEAGYSTDLGGRVGATWTHHNLFGNAERLRLTALITGVGGSAQQGLGYDIYADLFKPDFPGRNQNASFRLEGIRQLFYSYRQTALIARAGIVRHINRHWNVSYGLAGEQEKISQFGTTHDYTLVFAPVSANFDNTDLESPLLPATRGWRVSLSATPSASFDHGTSFFALLQANASTYVDLARTGLTRPGRSVFAFRAIVGSVQGASTYQIPPDQRLYGGGMATIRGFRYQGVGPQFGNTKYAIGGTSLDAGTVEFRQRVLKSFGAAAFVDAGQVGSGSAPFTGTVRVGAGGGVRYFTPIGPVRLDVAVPLNRPYRGDKWELYIGLGETF